MSNLYPFLSLLVSCSLQAFRHAETALLLHSSQNVENIERFHQYFFIYTTIGTIPSLFNFIFFYIKIRYIRHLQGMAQPRALSCRFSLCICSTCYR